MYQPNPIDTTDVVLPPELLALTEQIAEQVHETWAKGRMESGWTYGAYRDDAGKTTHCLVPYSELSEEEKAYDRETALGTLRLIYRLGYELVRRDGG